MAVLHRHRFTDFWTPKRVPLGQVAIDWSHDLSKGLVALYIPGGPSGLKNLAGHGSAPLLTAQSTGAFVASSIGTGISSLAASGGAQSTAGNPFPPDLQNVTSGTVNWIGDYVSTCPADSTLFGVQASTTSSILYILVNTATGLGFDYNTASTLRQITTGYVPSAGLHSLAASFVLNGGAYSIYDNGASIQSGTLVAGAPTIFNPILGIGGFTTRIVNVVSAAGHIYNRVLSGSEIAWLAAEPFAMLQPVARRVFHTANPSPPSAAPSVFLFGT